MTIAGSIGPKGKQQRPRPEPSTSDALRFLTEEERDRLFTLGRVTMRLSAFVRQAFAIVEPQTPYAHGPHIEVLCAHLEAMAFGLLDKLLMNIPPRFMKSLLVAVFFPAWVWGPFGDPGARFIYASYRERLSMRDSLRTRRIVESPWYRERFPRVQLLRDQNEKLRFDNTLGGYRIASSIGGGNTGEGADYVFADDPHNAKKIWSEIERENVIEWWDDVMSTRTGRWSFNRRGVIMQRLHEQDLSGHILATKPDYVHVFLPMEYDPGLTPSRAGAPVVTQPSPLPVDWRTTPGELLWEQRFDRASVRNIKASMTSYAYGGQFQQVPTPSEGGIIKREWLRFWEPPDEDFGPVVLRGTDGARLVRTPRKLPVEVDGYAQAWDFTFKKRLESDFVAGHVYCKATLDVFLMDRLFERMGFTETLAAFRELTTLWPEANFKYYEDAANGPAIEDSLRAEIQGIVAVSHENEDLLARVHAQTHIIESGHLYLPHPVMCPWVNELIEMLVAFPSGMHDDDLAALVTYLRKTFPRPAMSPEAQARRRTRYPVIQSR